ncbi:MAG: hypothetical protein SF002_04160, partial [Alphaproteobacteria bacterium]|nr:hypothetical protein [Alphaproteobacteria bacterium]
AAQFVLKSWLDSGACIYCVKDFLVGWLGARYLEKDAGYVITSALRAGIDDSSVYAHAERWVKIFSKEKAAIFPLKFLLKQKPLGNDLIEATISCVQANPLDEDSLFRLSKVIYAATNQNMDEWHLDLICNAFAKVFQEKNSTGGLLPTDSEVISMIFNSFCRHPFVRGAFWREILFNFVRFSKDPCFKLVEQNPKFQAVQWQILLHDAIEYEIFDLARDHVEISQVRQIIRRSEGEPAYQALLTSGYLGPDLLPDPRSPQ